jgi:hypothetical protein
VIRKVIRKRKFEPNIRKAIRKFEPKIRQAIRKPFTLLNTHPHVTADK